MCYVCAKTYPLIFLILLLLALALAACSDKISDQLKITVSEKVSDGDYLGFIVKVCPLEGESLYTDIDLGFCLQPNPNWYEEADEAARDPNNYVHTEDGWHPNAWANSGCSDPNLVKYSWDEAGDGCKEVVIPRVIEEYSSWSGGSFTACPFSSIQFAVRTYVRDKNGESVQAIQNAMWNCGLQASDDNGMTGAVIGGR